MATRPVARWSAACPRCHGPLGDFAGTVLRCLACRSSYRQVEGIWQFVLDEQRDDVEQFVADYTMLRASQPRTSALAPYYVALPHVSRGHPDSKLWSARARTWRHFRRRVLRRLPPAQRILDLGAGVGWMSYRLANLGHSPLAIDILQDPVDGLRAARHYPGGWPRVWAHFDHLPVADGTVDVLVYNASFHYSVDVHVTMTEARRVLQPQGLVVIMDTPIFSSHDEGRKMLNARHAAVGRRHRVLSAQRQHIGYLDEATIASLAEVHSIRWSRSSPEGRWRRTTRLFRSRLKGSYEQARFEMLVGRLA